MNGNLTRRNTGREKNLSVVIFGSTGNLTEAKLLPALERMEEDSLLGGERRAAVRPGQFHR